MDAFPGSTIAALCYARETKIDFHRLATELSQAVWKTENAARLDMPSADFALCDAPGLRIGLARVALDRLFPGSLTGRHYPSCMVLSVGPGETLPDTSMAARYARVRNDLLSRVQDMVAADRVLMFERAGTYDPEIHDAVVDDIRGHLDRVLSPGHAPVSDVTPPPVPARPPVGTAEPREDAGAPVEPDPELDTEVDWGAPARPLRAAARGPAPATDPGPARPVDVPHPEDIVQGLARRLEAELDRLDAARRALEDAQAAAGHRARRGHGMRLVVPRLFPSLPPATHGLFHMPARAATADGTRPAYPDYDQMPANLDDRPLLHRAAVNALNVTVMTIALPVGAALLTMSVLGREDMLFSSRVTAVTGVGVGLYNTGLAERVFALFS